MHTITGLPRSGSTLLCNVLNQNPRFYASSTSPLGMVIQNVSKSFSESPETVSYLLNDPKTPVRIKDSAKALADEWYKGKGVVFDKGRIWSHMGLIHQDLYPKGKMIVMVRDPRDVFASIEKQHRKEPMLKTADMADSAFARADTLLSPEGMIGGTIIGVMDLINRKLPVVFVRYEDFTEYPERTMKTIYEAIREKEYKHDFDKVVNVSEDKDETYYNKFPHEGSGKIQRVPSEWDKYIGEELADEIINRYPLFAKHFNYDN